MRGKSVQLIAAAAIVVMAACAGDTGEQEPAEDTAAEAPAAETPAEQPGAPTTGATAELPEGVTPEMVAQGQQIFNTQICFSCHGANGVGTVLAPPLNDQTWINIDGSYEGIMEVVRTGVAEPKEFQAPMPAMGGIQLTDEQIRQVAAYVYNLSHGG